MYLRDPASHHLVKQKGLENIATSLPQTNRHWVDICCFWVLWGTLETECIGLKEGGRSKARTWMKGIWSVWHCVVVKSGSFCDELETRPNCNSNGFLNSRELSVDAHQHFVTEKSYSLWVVCQKKFVTHNLTFAFRAPNNLLLTTISADCSSF